MSARFWGLLSELKVGAAMFMVIDEEVVIDTEVYYEKACGADKRTDWACR